MNISLVVGVTVDLSYPVLLCGGSGTRLWPLSRQSLPKQFASLLGEEDLFQQSARRLRGAGLAQSVVVTSEQFRVVIKEQLDAIGIEVTARLIEPGPRDTAPWDAVWQKSGEDPYGNVISSNTTTIECRQSLLRSEAESLELVGMGLDGVIAVTRPDAVLAARKARQPTAFKREHAR